MSASAATAKIHWIKSSLKLAHLAVRPFTPTQRLQSHIARLKSELTGAVVAWPEAQANHKWTPCLARLPQSGPTHLQCHLPVYLRNQPVTFCVHRLISNHIHYFTCFCFLLACRPDWCLYFDYVLFRFPKKNIEIKKGFDPPASACYWGIWFW